MHFLQPNFLLTKAIELLDQISLSSHIASTTVATSLTFIPSLPKLNFYGVEKKQPEEMELKVNDFISDWEIIPHESQQHVEDNLEISEFYSTIVATAATSLLSLFNKISTVRAVFSSNRPIAPIYKEITPKIVVKVAILVENHFKPEHRAYNQSIVKHNYAPQDLILIEEDVSKSSAELTHEQLPDLSSKDYKYKGWVPTEHCKSAAKLKIQLKPILKAIKGLEQGVDKHGVIPGEKRSWYSKLIVSFARKHDLPFVREEDYHPFTSQIFMEEKQKMLKACRSYCKALKDDFATREFPITQKALIAQIRTHAHTASIRTIWTIIGELHKNKELMDSLTGISVVVYEQPKS